MFTPYFITQGQVDKFALLTEKQVAKVANDNNCEISHVEYVLSGLMKVRHANRGVVNDAIQLTKGGKS